MEPTAERGAWIDLANEFAAVQVRKVRWGNGERLEIRSVKLGYSVMLDPVALESLTWQPDTVFSEFLKTPFGPEGAAS